MHRITENTKFFQINYRKKDKTIAQLFSSIEKAEEKYYKIFKVKPNKYTIIVCYSRDEFSEQVGYKSPSWEQGTVIKNKLIMFSPLVRDKLVVTKLPKQWDYDTFFDHEINHFFYISYVGNYKPLWLSEGYATYMMNEEMIQFLRGRIKNTKKIKNPMRFLVYWPRESTYEKYNAEIFTISTLFVGYLIENFGHKKIISLIKAYKTTLNKKDFEKDFNKIYGFSINDALKKAL